MYATYVHLAPPKGPRHPRPRPCVAEMDAHVYGLRAAPRIRARRGSIGAWPPILNVFEEIPYCTIQYSVGPVLKLCSESVSGLPDNENSRIPPPGSDAT
jgi:hypothetical protein